MVKKQDYTLVAIFFLILVVDQLTKFFARKIGTSIPIIKDILHLTFVKNTGIGFGLLQDTNTLFIFVSIIAVGLILYYFHSLPKEAYPRYIMTMIVAGIVGNLIDRASLGYVTDFIDFRVWPVFNIADSAISVGVILLVVYFFRKN